jgi:hypothetical protein
MPILPHTMAEPPKMLFKNYNSMYPALVYDRNHLFGLGSDTETETENWPKLSADTETNRNCKIYIKHVNT